MRDGARKRGWKMSDDQAGPGFRPHDDAEVVRSGWALAHWLAANAERLQIATLIYDDLIWTARRGDEGWRPYEHPSGDTTNVTLRHLDHVHVDVLAG
jgi:hypothetical protein